MNGVPIEHGLLLATILFSLGLLGVLVRRNIIFVLMSMEIMFNAVGLAFSRVGLVGAYHLGRPLREKDREDAQ